VGRQALHAATLGFRHPISGEPMAFTAPLREDLAELVRTLRCGGRFEPIEVGGATVDLERAVARDSK
jgi:hypothetical protein